MSRRLIEKDYQELLKCIQEAKETATMENADFDSFGSIGADDDDAPQKPGEDITVFIRRRTRIWRESWLVGPLATAEAILKERARRD